MARAVEQAMLLELALNLDQRGAKAAQQSDGHRLIVDEGAAAPVGAEAAAQDQARLLQIDAVLGEPLAYRVHLADIEHGDDRSLVRSRAQQAGLGAAAEGQTQGVEQDRLARPGFPGQRAKPTIEGQIEMVDQDQIPDRQAMQHSGSCPQKTESQVRETQPWSPSSSGMTSTPVRRA